MNSQKPARIVYLFVNIALSISIALPMAGIINHLIDMEGQSFGRGVMIWLAITAFILIISLPLIPFFQRRIEVKSQKTKHE